ncbi:hypothetical protein Tco_0364978 [Tanacetum coccineum]
MHVALTMSRTEPKNIKEAMDDSVWIEAMHEELHQFDRLKYAQEILKKHGMTSCDSIGTPMATKHLDANLSGTPVDQMKYHRMVEALMYLRTSRPDIVHATCYCARYQVKLTEKHLITIKWIFRYLKDTINIGLWYPKDTGFELTTFLYSDHAGCLDSCKSTSGGIQFLGGDKLVSWSSKKQDCTSMSSVEADFDKLQPSQFSVIHHPPQATDMEMLQARENLMEAIQAFLKKYDHIPPKEKCMALLLAEKRFLKIKQVVKEEQN